MVRLVLALLLVSSSVALAQPAGAQAETLFRQGRDLMTAGKLPEACAAFQESQRLEPAITTLINLAGCREKNGQLASAWGLFLDAERETRSATDASNRQLHDVAKARAAKLEGRVSKLEIDVPDASKLEGLEVTRGDEHVDAAMWNHSLPVDGGTYTITAKAPGAQPWSTQITIAGEHDAKTLEIPKLPPAPKSQATTTTTTTTVTTSPSPQPAVVTDAPAGSSKTLPIAVGAGAVVLLGAGLGFDLWGNSTYDDAKAEMTSQSRRDSLYDSANTKRTAAFGFAVGGVAAAGVAVWLFVRAGHGQASAHETTVVVPTPNGIALMGSY